MPRILTLLAAMVFTGAAIWGAVFQLTNNSRLDENTPTLQETATSSEQTYATPSVFDLPPLSAAGGVVPHHLLAQEIIDDFFRSLSKKGIPETIVLLSPDHFKAWLIKGQRFIGPDLTIEKLDGLTIDREILQKLIAENMITAGTSFIIAEHGITALLPFIKRYFPETKVLPLLAPPNIKEREVEELINIINASASEKTIIIASVDFSHYLPKSAADFHDIKSIAALIHFKEDEFADLEVDCWQCLYGARLFAKLRGRELPEIIAHKNSVDFLSFDSAQDESFDSAQGKPDAEETTSYFSVVFAAPPLASPTTEPAFPEFNAKTVLLVGDIMLGRYVETLMKKNDNFYPFRKIDNFLKGTDIVFGNLEGPIVENPPKFPFDSLRFAFPPAVTEALSFVKFNLLSLANNHTLDAGMAGLAKTKKFLEKTGINFVGDPIKCSEDFLFEKDNLIFLAINKTYPFNCSNEEISRVIKSVKSERPENFLVVSIHWGEEYSPKSSASQQELARQMIEAGADAIFGHHPHVVQEIEIYKNKLIFYSLGNFVFDQYFSKETQEGLAVGLEIWPKKTIFRLFPIKLPLSQPLLMNHKEAGEFLKKLAKKSSTALAEKIKSGLIEN